MAFRITDDCINCGVCEVECPLGAVLPGGVNWRNKYDELFMFTDVPPIKDPCYSDSRFYIVPEICNECKNYFSEPRCSIVCPMESIVKDAASKSSGRMIFRREIICKTTTDLIQVN